MSFPRILVVEDDADIAALVALHLKSSGKTVVLAPTAQEGMDQARAQTFGLIVLDVMLPDGDGFDLCQRLRASGDSVPILMLTARDTEHDRLLGFDLGADDYLTKPFSVRELVARVTALLRRSAALHATPSARGPSVVRAGGLSLDCERHTATLGGATLTLTAKEFELLLQFARHPGQVFRRSQLLDLVWGYGHERYGHTVNSLINRLRAKIERDPQNPACIVTEWGLGYTFHAPADLSAE